MKNGFSKKVLMITVFCLIFTGVLLTHEKSAYAATVSGSAIKVVAVEYYDEQIVVQNNGNTKICFATESDAARDNWEVVNADSGIFTAIDISWMSPGSENIIIFKGYDDKSNTKSRVVVNPTPTKLEVSINYANMDTKSASDSISGLVNIMTSVGNGLSPITFADLEWKKGETGTWQTTEYKDTSNKDVYTLTVGQLEKYLVKGTNLYFRIRAKDDVVSITSGSAIDLNVERARGVRGGIMKYNSIGTTVGTDFPDGTDGRRFSKEVKVKIAKKPTSAVTGIDGGKFTADIRYGKEYRVTYDSATPSGWVRVVDNTSKSIPLSTIIGNPAVNGSVSSAAFKVMKIEIRDYATSKSASSKITEINLDAQRTLDNPIIEGKAPADAISAGNPNIFVSYIGDKNLVLQIPLATPNRPYEYCVIKTGSGETYDVAKATWTAVTKGTEVKIPVTKAVDGGTLYVRQKEIKYKAATKTASAVPFQLASTNVNVIINYPSIPEIADASYTFTKGEKYAKDIDFNVVLNKDERLPYETEIASIKLGTRLIEFTPSAKGTNTTTAQTIKITLKADSLATLSNCVNKAITIIYKNGTIDKTSIKLTVQTPADAGSLSLTAKKGTTKGTAITMGSTRGLGNSWVYVLTTKEITKATNVDTVKTVTGAADTDIISFTTSTVDDIATVASDTSTSNYLNVFEVNTSGYIVKYKCIKLTTDNVK